MNRSTSAVQHDVEMIGNVPANQVVLNGDLLLLAFEKLPQIEFQNDWRNGTGYYDGAVFDENPLTAISGSIDPESGTRVVLVPVRKGIMFFNVVFFIKGGRVCCNAPVDLFRTNGRVNVYFPDGRPAYGYEHRVVTGETFTYANRWYQDGEYSYELYEYARMITDIAAQS